MRNLRQDIRFGIRSFVKSPRFTIVAVVTLALGIGANTAMFSVIHCVLLKAWPVRDSSRLVVVSQRQANGNSNLFSTQDFLDWKHQGGLLAQMAPDVSWEFNLSGVGTQPERVAGGEVSSDWLPILGVEPIQTQDELKRIRTDLSQCLYHLKAVLSRLGRGGVGIAFFRRRRSRARRRTGSCAGGSVEY
jgi:MacB-like periplasmic core domain